MNVIHRDLNSHNCLIREVKELFYSRIIIVGQTERVIMQMAAIKVYLNIAHLPNSPEKETLLAHFG